MKTARGEKIPLLQFYQRRFLRTLPNYYAVLALTYAVVTGSFGEPWPSPWKYLVFLQNFGIVFSAVIVTWSLCIEEHFYLVFPIVVKRLLSARSARLSLAVAGTVLASQVVIRALLWLWVRPDLAASGYTPYFQYFYFPTFTRLDGLTLGVGLAAVHRLRPELYARIAPHYGRERARSVVA